MHAVVVDHPGRSAVGVQDVAEQAVGLARDLLRDQVEPLEHLQVRAVEVGVAAERGHEVGAEQDDERIAALPDRRDQRTELRAEQLRRRAATGVVEAVGDHQQVGRVGDHVLADPLAGGRPAGVGIGGDPVGDHVGADAGVDQPHRLVLKVADQRGQDGGPAALPDRAPAAGGRALPQRHQHAERGGVTVDRFPLGRCRRHRPEGSLLRRRCARSSRHRGRRVGWPAAGVAAEKGTESTSMI